MNLELNSEYKPKLIFSWVWVLGLTPERYSLQKTLLHYLIFKTKSNFKTHLIT